jgi:hypothetical protein
MPDGQPYNLSGNQREMSDASGIDDSMLVRREQQTLLASSG